MERLIFDAGPLITACKFTVRGSPIIDYILEHRVIAIAASVRDEVVKAGSRYPDASTAQQRIMHGLIDVLSPLSTKPDIDAALKLYQLGIGEYDSILLATDAAAPTPTVVLDDHLAYLVSDRLHRRQRFLLDVIIDLVRSDNLERDLAIDIVQAIRQRYPPAFVEHTLLVLRR